MWLEAVDNAEAVCSLYDSPPSLKRVWTRKVELQQDGPTLALHIQIRDLPNRPPPRWREPYNAVTFEMLLLGASDLHVEGWDTENIADVLFRRNETGTIEASILGGRFVMSPRCIGIRVQKFSPFLADHE